MRTRKVTLKARQQGVTLRQRQVNILNRQAAKLKRASELLSLAATYLLDGAPRTCEQRAEDALNMARDVEGRVHRLITQGT